MMILNKFLFFISCFILSLNGFAQLDNEKYNSELARIDYKYSELFKKSIETKNFIQSRLETYYKINNKNKSELDKQLQIELKNNLFYSKNQLNIPDSFTCKKELSFVLAAGFDDFYLDKYQQTFRKICFFDTIPTILLWKDTDLLNIQYTYEYEAIKRRYDFKERLKTEPKLEKKFRKYIFKKFKEDQTLDFEEICFQYINPQ